MISADLECILGRCDSLRAEVYVRAALPAGVPPAAVSLSGTLTGPESRHGITLPATARLMAVRDEGEPSRADTLVSRAVLTEPAFWTPDVPSLYRLEARLAGASQEPTIWQRAAGLRRLGVRGRSLWLDGHRYVPRGLQLVEVAHDAPAGRDPELAAFRTAALAAVVDDPTEEFLGRCDSEGVVVIAALANRQGQPLDVRAAVAAVARWAWHPAVFVAVVPAGVSSEAAADIETACRCVKGTLLLGREVDGRQPPPTELDRFDLAIVAVPPDGLPDEAWRTTPPAVPLIAHRRALPPAAAEAGQQPEEEAPSRRPCDALQANLARWAGADPAAFRDWAGYLVGARASPANEP